MTLLLAELYTYHIQSSTYSEFPEEQNEDGNSVMRKLLFGYKITTGPSNLKSKLKQINYKCIINLSNIVWN